MTTSSQTNKDKVKLVAKLLLVVLATVALASAARSFAANDRPEDATDIFSEAVPPRSELVDEVTWVPDVDGLVREMDPLTREKITEAWVGAFEAKAAQARGDSDWRQQVEVYFAGPALGGFTNATTGADTRQLSHELQLRFLSADGQVVAIRSLETKTATQYIHDESVTTQEQTETYQAVILLEDGNWRIRQLVRTISDVEWAE